MFPTLSHIRASCFRTGYPQDGFPQNAIYLLRLGQQRIGRNIVVFVQRLIVFFNYLLRPEFLKLGFKPIFVVFQALIFKLLSPGLFYDITKKFSVKGTQDTVIIYPSANDHSFRFNDHGPDRPVSAVYKLFL